jgi:archaellum biogenesis protein FlaJ (TadC family)
MIYAVLIGFDSSERQRQIWLLIIILGQFAGYFFIYLITPHDLSWHISTSMDRVISHLFPMLIFWLFVALKPPQLA